jgi:hypothetical protein
LPELAKENGAQRFNIDDIDSYLNQIRVAKVIKYPEIEVALHSYSSNIIGGDLSPPNLNASKVS